MQEVVKREVPEHDEDRIGAIFAVVGGPCPLRRAERLQPSNQACAVVAAGGSAPFTSMESFLRRAWVGLIAYTGLKGVPFAERLKLSRERLTRRGRDSEFKTSDAGEIPDVPSARQFRQTLARMRFVARISFALFQVGVIGGRRRAIGSKELDRLG